MGKIHVIIIPSMTHHFFTTAFVCLAALFSTVSAQTIQEQRLKSDLETVYNTWRQSMLRENYEGWLQTTSAYRKMKVRNLAVSEKRPFPASLFAHQMSPPSLMPLRYVGAVVKGPTAAATYFGKVDMDIGGNPSENALVLLFNYERGAWKYDQARFFNLGNLPDVKERLRNGDAKILQEQDGFQPTGVIPPVPPACPAPKYIAKVFIDCPGRKVDITVNNISTHNFENTRMAEVISGGVRDGMNSILITSTPIADSKDKGPMLVEVFIMPETEGNIPGKAFTFTLPEENQGNFQEVHSFSVTPDVILKMRPTAPKK